jgi:hypothetical protein
MPATQRFQDMHSDARADLPPSTPDENLESPGRVA